MHITDRGADFLSTISQQVSVERLFLRKPVESEFRTDKRFLEEGRCLLVCTKVPCCLVGSLSHQRCLLRDQTNAISENEPIAFVLLFRAWFWLLIQNPKPWL